MKNFILTIDYELHLGNVTGSVRECMIEPTRKLMDILDINHSTMTVFWDILHYYKLLELQSVFPALKEECTLIEKQVKEMYERGHDIQLHIHPHWLDARYMDGKWVFGYSRFSLKCLGAGNDKADINTVNGCIYQCKKLLEDFMHTFAPGYKVTTFRAGGYLVEPFSLLREELLASGITIDSSVCPDMVMKTAPFDFDFRGYPSRRYSFIDKLQEPVSGGNFTEYPITTVSIPVRYKFYFRLLFRLKYTKYLKELKGTGSCNSVSVSKPNAFIRFLDIFVRKEVCQLTPDVSFKEKFAYLISKSPDDSVMILHPKFLNSHTYTLLKEMLRRNRMYCRSIASYESELKQLEK